MKKKFYCPACGARELSQLFITTHKGTKLSLLLSSQANIRKSSGEAMCENCKNVWLLADTHMRDYSGEIHSLQGVSGHYS